MSYWMLYAVATGALLLGAALLAERALLALRRPVRGVWAAALTGTLLLPLLLPRLRAAEGGRAGEVVVGEVMVLRAAGGAAEAAPAAVQWTAVVDGVLGWGWALASAALAAWLLLSAARLARARRGWRPARLGATRVLLSRDTGPAVVGVVAPEIVVPEWVLGWGEAERRLLLAHEREHLYERDPRLALAAALALVAMPWNAALWIIARRLRHAIEMDCDARVLALRPEPRRYGMLLLEVSRRVAGVGAPGVAFAEERGSLERRVRALTGAGRPARGRAVAAAAGAALLAPLAAFALPTPPDPPAPPLPPAVAPAAPVPPVVPAAPLRALRVRPALPPVEPALPSDTPPPPGGLPTATPYDVRPQLTNREEFAQLLERSYPPLLREAGVGGTVVLWVRVDQTGAVPATRVDRTSGHPELDRAAEAAMRAARFSPARRDGKPVPIWIQLPVTFQTAASRDENRPTAGNAELPEPDRRAIVAAVARHHPDALRRGLPEPGRVWFLVSPGGAVLETGIGSQADVDRVVDRVGRRMQFAYHTTLGAAARPVTAVWIPLR